MFKGQKDAESKTKTVLFIISIIFTPLTLAGILIGYMRAYNRFMRTNDQMPLLYNLPKITRTAMVIGGVVIWVFLLLVIYVLVFFMNLFFSEEFLNSPAPLILICFNIVFSFIVFSLFNRWRNRIFKDLHVQTRYGTARFAKEEELEDLVGNKGLYIGGGCYSYSKQGHLLSVFRTRGGKGTNLIIPNLLGKSQYEGSLVIIDPKAENLAVTGRYQRSISGRNVLAIDPWKLHSDSSATFNPLDLLPSSANDDRLADYADSLAEILVPSDASTKEPFFNDRARSFILHYRRRMNKGAS